jgi:hypothetical protein
MQVHGDTNRNHLSLVSDAWLDLINVNSCWFWFFFELRIDKLRSLSYANDRIGGKNKDKDDKGNLCSALRQHWFHIYWWTSCLHRRQWWHNSLATTTMWEVWWCWLLAMAYRLHTRASEQFVFIFLFLCQYISRGGHHNAPPLEIVVAQADSSLRL